MRWIRDENARAVARAARALPRAAPRRPSGRGLRATAALLLLVSAVFCATRVMGVRNAPQQAPPVMAAVTPAEWSHKPADGYLVYLSLTVRACDKPVEGSIHLRYPAEFRRAEEETFLDKPATHVLAGIAVSDANVKIKQVRPEAWFPDQPRPAWWDRPLPALDPHFEGYKRGRVGLTRLDHWRRSYEGVSVDFTARWLRPRGYKSCWLAVPELVGRQQTEFSVQAEQSVNAHFAAEPVSDPISNISSEVGGNATVVTSDGRRSEERSGYIFGPEYVSGLTSAAFGSVIVRGGLDVVPEASRAEAIGPGEANWRCLAPSDSDFFKSGWQEGGGFIWVGSSVKEIRTSGTRPGCAGWVVLAEPGAVGWRDAWLLIIGAIVSLASALLVEAVLATRGRSRG